MSFDRGTSCVFHIAQARAKCIKESKESIRADKARADGREWRKGMRIHNLPFLRSRRTALCCSSLTPNRSLNDFDLLYLHYILSTLHPPSQPRLFRQSTHALYLQLHYTPGFDHPFILSPLFTLLDIHTGRHTFHTELLDRYHRETELLVID